VLWFEIHSIAIIRKVTHRSTRDQKLLKKEQKKHFAFSNYQKRKN